MPAVRWFVTCVLIAGVMNGCGFPSSPGARIVEPDSGDERVWMYSVPPPGEYNGALVLWCPSMQYATTPVGFPEEIAFSDADDPDAGLNLPNLINGLGFAFAVRAYSENGLAVDQYIVDTLEMIDIFTEREGAPEKIFVAGASGGGIVATLLLERYPELFAGGLAACGPIGDFNQEIEYLLDARATFEVYFPGAIPGPVFDPPADLVNDWARIDDDEGFFYDTLLPILEDPANRGNLYEWVKVANLTYDPEDPINTMLISARAVLSFVVLNFQAAKEHVGGIPYSNIDKLYTGSKDDDYLNATVPRMDGDAHAAQFIRDEFTATGNLVRPLMTMHTTGDPLVPYWHETQYTFKHFMNAPLAPMRLHLRVPRYGHCEFQPAEPLIMFALLLLYDGDPAIIRSALGGLIDIDSTGVIRSGPSEMEISAILRRARRFAAR